MSQGVGTIETVMSTTFVSQTGNIPRTRKRPSELWLVFLKRKSRSASKEEGGLAHQGRLICIGGKSTLGLAAGLVTNDWALGLNGDLGV